MQIISIWKKTKLFLIEKNTNMPSLWEKLLNTRLPKIFNRNLSWCLHCVPKPLTNCIIHNIHFKINSNLINDIRSLCACWNYVPTFFFYLSIKHMYHNTFNIFQVLIISHLLCLSNLAFNYCMRSITIKHRNVPI